MNLRFSCLALAGCTFFGPSAGQAAGVCAADWGAPAPTEQHCADGVDDDDGGCGDRPTGAARSPLADVRISEILANTPGGTDVEYVELVNLGEEPQDLSGWYLLDDDDQHEPCLLEGTLGPGERLVVAGNVEAFMQVWDVPNLHPVGFQGPAGSGFALGNHGDEIRLFRPTPRGALLVHGFTFGLQGEDIPFGFRFDGGDVPEYLGYPTPGADNVMAGVHSTVCINEFLTTSAAGGIDDWIELYNRGATAVDISGWRLSDEAGPDGRYTFPTGTVLPPGGYLVVDETVLGFALSSTGSEVVQLIHFDGVTGQDYFDYGPQFPDISTGRAPDGAPFWSLLDPPSPGAPNDCALGVVAALVFSSASLAEWSTVDAAMAYDVVRGSLEALVAAGGDFSSADPTCLANDIAAPRTADPAVPDGGSGWFYLVRADGDACNPGSYDGGYPSQIGSRDAEIEQAGAVCD